MTYKIHVSRTAQKQIEQIIEYISDDLKNLSAATNFYTKIFESYDRLKNNPHIYALCEYESIRKLGYRKVIIGNYLMFYKIYEEKKEVFIARVIYGKRDYIALL